MEIFRHLTHEQLAAIADCLIVEQYEVGCGWVGGWGVGGGVGGGVWAGAAA